MKDFLALMGCFPPSRVFLHMAVGLQEESRAGKRFHRLSYAILLLNGDTFNKHLKNK